MGVALCSCGATPLFINLWDSKKERKVRLFHDYFNISHRSFLTLLAQV